MTDESDIALSYDTPEVNGILKMFNVRVSSSYVSLAEKLIDYIFLANDVMNTRLFIFLFLRPLLNAEDLRELYKVAFYRKCGIILIESNSDSLLDCEKVYIIDKDLCSII